MATLWDQSRSYQKVALERVEVEVRLGAYPQERDLPQRVIVDVELYRHKGVHGGGGLGECLNYDRVFRYLLETWPHRPHTDLLEELAEDLIAVCLGDLRVEACRIVIRKPQVYGGNGAPALEIYRLRDHR